MHNIILTGMPTSGKSTVGVVLAKDLGYDFLDGDLLIQKRMGKRLSSVMEEIGRDAFLRLEEEIHCALSCDHTVLAPGGSVIYGKKAMDHLSSIGTIVYLRMEPGDLLLRLHDARNRGVALKEGQTIEDMYYERVPLYERYADITIEEHGKTLEQVVMEIKDRLGLS